MKNKLKIKLKTGTEFIIEKLRKQDSYYSILSNTTANKARGDYKRIGTVYDIQPFLEFFEIMKGKNEPTNKH